jgi:hypothetical protein
MGQKKPVLLSTLGGGGGGYSLTICDTLLHSIHFLRLKYVRPIAIFTAIQCCHGAEISAAKHKRARKKLWGRESLGPNFGRIIKKGPKRGRTFF